jgi:hypothetical protein
MAAATVASGKAAYWLYQGLGNAPDAQDLEKYAKVLRNFDSAGSTREFRETFKHLADQSFVAPTSPCTVFLDTRMGRTRRHYTHLYEIQISPVSLEAIPHDGKLKKLKFPHLFGEKEYLHRFKSLIRDPLAAAPDRRVNIVTATPVFELTRIEKNKAS